MFCYISVFIINYCIASIHTSLGYNYFITGEVVKGRGLGRKLDFPTANIYIKESYKLIPRDGVYIVKSQYNNNSIFGMMNIGVNPTVRDTDEVSIEVNLLNFSGNLYGQELQVKALTRLRDELKFNSLEDLKIQLSKDERTVSSAMG